MTSTTAADAVPALTPRLVDRASQLHEVLEALDKGFPVALDTEFHSERTYVPRLMLLQLATPEGLWLLDPLSLDLKPVIEKLASPGQVVLGHAVRNDLRILWQVYGVRFDMVLDTQVAAAFLGHGLQVGLAHLLMRELNVKLSKGEQMADWSQRPLPEKLKVYAAGDVLYLAELWQLLVARLQERGRLGWVEQECRDLCDPSQFDRDPDQAGDRVSGARRLDARETGVVYALAAERERLAQQEDVVPHFLLPDEMLLAMAKALPRTLRDLQADRRLQQRGVHRHGQRWLDAIALGLQNPIQRAPGRAPPPPELEAVAGLAMLLLADLAARELVAPQLLLKRDTLIGALQDAPSSAEDLAKACGLRGWRKELVLAPLWQFLTGRTLASCAVGGEAGVRLVFAPAIG
jgi:ribonuclease D